MLVRLTLLLIPLLCFLLNRVDIIMRESLLCILDNIALEYILWRRIIVAVFENNLSTNHDQLCFRLETSGITLDKDMFLSNGMLGLDLHKECFKFRTSSEQQQQQQQQQQEKNTAVTNIILPRRYDAPFCFPERWHEVGRRGMLGKKWACRERRRLRQRNPIITTKNKRDLFRRLSNAQQSWERGRGKGEAIMKMHSIHIRFSPIQTLKI